MAGDHINTGWGARARGLGLGATEPAGLAGPLVPGPRWELSGGRVPTTPADNPLPGQVRGPGSIAVGRWAHSARLSGSRWGAHPSPPLSGQREGGRGEPRLRGPCPTPPAAGERSGAP